MTAHQKYCAVYALIQNSEKTFKKVFDDFRRSTALSVLTRIYCLKLVDDMEFQNLSEETKNFVVRLSGDMM